MTNIPENGPAHVLWHRDTAVAPPLVCLAEGTELIGEYRGSGRLEVPYLVRRADGRMLELSPLLYLVASSLDGHRTLSEIATIVARQSRRPVTVENVAYMIDRKLRPLRVIQEDVEQPGGAPSPVPVLGLQLRTSVLPTSLVTAVTAVLRPVFAPTAVLSVLGTLVGVDTWMILDHHIGQGVTELVRRPGLLLLAMALTLTAAVFHEMGHATASRYGGAKPGAIGIGVYLIWPVFYNDLTDSYRLSRGGRLRCDLGGVYFNVIFILMVVGLYGVTGLTSLLAVVALQHLVILQQFLPFVRLDGYYIVSDLAGVPDLFGRIRPILAGLIPGRRPDRRVSDLLPRARIIVTAWVLVTVPLLMVGVGLLALSAPHLMRVMSHSFMVQRQALGASLRAGDPVAALWNGLQLLAVVPPVVGLSVVVLGLVRRLSRLYATRYRAPIVAGLRCTIAVLIVMAITGVSAHDEVLHRRGSAGTAVTAQNQRRHFETRP